MKNKIALLILIIITSSLFSCSPRITYFPAFHESLVFDFKEYSMENFLITPEKYTGEYESIGMIDISIYPAAARQANIPKAQNIVEGEYAQGYWLIAKIKPEEVVRTIYDKAHEMGADAVVNFKVTPLQKKNWC